MKTQTKLINSISENKAITKLISNNRFYSAESFINDANRYIKAIKEQRMICNIISISKSGMSRTIKFVSCEKNKQLNIFYYSNYNMLFTCLGFSKSRSNDFAFTIYGCGMDMIFHTNYTIIHRLGRLGFLSKKEVAKLAQMTPTVI